MYVISKSILGSSADRWQHFPAAPLVFFVYVYITEVYQTHVTKYIEASKRAPLVDCKNANIIRALNCNS